MMILAVHVSRNRAAQRHEARARRDRRKISARQEHVEQLGDSDAGLASEQPAGRIEGEHPIEPRQIDHAILIVERRIAISAPQSARNQRRGIPADDGLQLGNSIRPINIALGKRVAPPSGEHRMPRVRRRSRGRRHKEKRSCIEVNRKSADEKRSRYWWSGARAERHKEGAGILRFALNDTRGRDDTRKLGGELSGGIAEPAPTGGCARRPPLP